MSDISGLEIAYANHLVALGYYHSKIIITPENQAKYENNPLFQNFDSKGRRYATIGAGPENGDLIAAMNRERDLSEPCHNRKILKLPILYKNEDEAIQELLKKLTKYNLKPLPYTLFPESGKQEYNSNSFISEIGKAAGFELPLTTGAKTPGYENPVPEGQFK